MKRAIRGVGLAAWLIGVPFAASAAPISTTLINDTYWGYNDHGYGDVISSASSKSFFDIDHLKVVFDRNNMVRVTVYTGFKEGDPRAEGTQYGDLFIGSGGWHPYAGTDPLHFKQDRLGNTGTQWNYVIDTSEGGRLYGNGFSTYVTDDLLDASRYIFRNGQVVQRKSGGTLLETEAVVFGTDWYNNINYNTITYSFDWTRLGVKPGDALAFKWGMTCANDTIEGQARVPVPSTGTLPLLFIGVVALGRWLQRGRKKDA